MGVYVFKGIHPFLDASAAARKVDGQLVGQTRGVWHAKRVQDALGQLAAIDANPHAPASAKSETLSYAVNVGLSLVAAAEGCVAAIVEAAKAHGFDVGELDAIASAEANKQALAKAQAEVADLKAQLAKIAADKAAEAEAKAEADEAARAKAEEQAEAEAKAKAAAEAQAKKAEAAAKPAVDAKAK